MTSKLLTSTLRRALPSLKSNAPIVKAAGAQQQQARCSLSTTMTSMTTSTSLSPPSQQCAFSTLSPAIHSYNESVSEMTNEQLADPTTIPGFTTLIHSPPKDRSTTPRRALFGKVVSTKMQKTVNVEVNRFKIHSKYHKRMRFTRKFMAHDEAEVCNEGDWVVIAPCHKMSKKKHFRVHEIVKQKGVL